VLGKDITYFVRFCMAARKNTSQINLLPQEEFASSVLGRTLSWALSTFRIVVIITEVIVMAAFLSRFWLDARSNDLNDLIRGKEAVIAASTQFENEFKDVQKRLKIFSAITTQTFSSSLTLKELSTLLPPDTYISSLSFQEINVQIKGVSLSEIGVSQFIANLEANSKFKNVTLQSVNSGTQDKSQIIFTISVDLSGKGGK
jgi:Tfp pilus assembly protein PilN